MNEAAPSSRDRLIAAAARLFRQRGYHGAGIADILAESGAPRSSLYHHFPNGKADLGRAAAEWAGAGMLRIIDDSFANAPDYATGAATLCHKLAKFFDISDHRDGCPVSSVLYEDTEETGLRQAVDTIFEGWIAATAAHARRLGVPAEKAGEAAETLLMAIQGAWILARARRSSDVLRSIPGRLPEV